MLQISDMDQVTLLSNFEGWQKDIIMPDFERDSVFMETGKSFLTIYFQRRPIRLYYERIAGENRPLFIVQAGRPLDDVQSTLQRLAFIMFLTIPALVALACIAGWILAKRSFQPVDSMISKARGITAAYLKGRLPRTLTGDELDRLAETLNQMMDRIESSTRAIQDFSSDLSHELKTPLAIIRGEIDLALRKPRSADELKNTFKVIGEEVDELIRMVDDLMILVRSDAKQLQFVKIRVSLKEILIAVIDRFYQKAEFKQIKLKSELPEDAEIEGDTVYLKRLFSNLVDNALKFTPPKGEVRVRLLKSKQKALVEVIDNGPGIDFDVQSKVFARFYRTEHARAQEGAGLGLNIAKAIADAHNGIISINSQPQHGTTIQVSFPRI